MADLSGYTNQQLARFCGAQAAFWDDLHGRFQQIADVDKMLSAVGAGLTQSQQDAIRAAAVNRYNNQQPKLTDFP